MSPNREPAGDRSAPDNSGARRVRAAWSAALVVFGIVALAASLTKPRLRPGSWSSLATFSVAGDRLLELGIALPPTEPEYPFMIHAGSTAVCFVVVLHAADQPDASYLLAATGGGEGLHPTRLYGRGPTSDRAVSQMTRFWLTSGPRRVVGALDVATGTLVATASPSRRSNPDEDWWPTSLAVTPLELAGAYVYRDWESADPALGHLAIFDHERRASLEAEWQAKVPMWADPAEGVLLWQSSDDEMEGRRAEEFESACSER